MTPAFAIEPHGGVIRIGEDLVLARGRSRTEVERLAAEWLIAVRDHGNGYAWLDLDGLAFGGHPAALSLCFHHGRLSEAAWSVSLPGAPQGWPDQHAIDAEICFVRATLAQAIGYLTNRDDMRYPWGEVWSCYDPRAGIASNGLRFGS